tara:strand:+ start:24401 stop:24892 length:492 start_codon:yes stop_codon:yes gene_type:complete
MFSPSPGRSTPTIYKWVGSGGLVDLIQIKEYREEEQELSLSHFNDLIYSTKYCWSFKISNGKKSQPIAVCGLREIREGVAEAWMVGSKLLNRHRLFVTKSIALLLLEHQEVRKEFYRIQATVRADWETANKWIKLLGFDYEGYMRQYGSKREDYIRYARLLWR